MTAVIQRVNYVFLKADGKPFSEIGKGLLILLGVFDTDTEKESELLANKISGLRIFEDKNYKMNLSVDDIEGEIMVVPNFTLCAETRRGKRPSFINAARPEKAEPLFELFKQTLKTNKKFQSVSFGAHMDIDITADGPITIIFDTDNF